MHPVTTSSKRDTSSVEEQPVKRHKSSHLPQGQLVKPTQFSLLEGVSLKQFREITNGFPGKNLAERACEYLNDRRAKYGLPALPFQMLDPSRFFESYKEGHKELLSCAAQQFSIGYAPYHQIARFSQNPIAFGLERNEEVVNDFLKDIAEIEGVSFDTFYAQFDSNSPHDYIRQAFKKLNMRRHDLGLKPTKIPYENQNLVAIYKKGFQELKNGEKANRMAFMRALHIPVNKKDSPDTIQTQLENWIQRNGARILRISARKKKISWIPPEIFQLSALQSLDLTMNNLTKIPQEIQLFTRLTHLSIGENDLETLPPEIGLLQNLESLTVDHNHLKTLPNEIGNLGHLRSLDVSSNQLTTLPPLGLIVTTLKDLWLNSNFLKKLPDELVNSGLLNILNVSHNQLEILPTDLGNLTRLKHLDASYNKLQALPPSITNLKLSWLIVNNNNIPFNSPELQQMWNKCMVKK